MDIKKLGARYDENETTLGIYVWEMPDGRWIGDDDGNFLSVTSQKGNRSKIENEKSTTKNTKSKE